MGHIYEDDLYRKEEVLAAQVIRVGGAVYNE